MIYVVLQAVLKNDLYIRLTHNFHYRNPLLLVCPVGLFPLPATLWLAHERGEKIWPEIQAPVLVI